MFSNLKEKDIIYILDKSNDISVKLGTITHINNTNTPYYNITPTEIEFNADVNGDNYEFKKIPASMSIYCPNKDIVISDNKEDLLREYDNMVKLSKQVLDSIPYHQKVIESEEAVLAVLNPKYAEVKEQKKQLENLETRVGGVEQGISDIKNMLTSLLSKN